VRVDWGDGTPNDVFDVYAWGELAREHLYPAPGRYWAVVSVRDHRGSAGAATFRIDVDGQSDGGAPQQLCIVPKLRGKTLLAARRALAPRCRLGRLTRAFSTSMRRGRILAQSPRAGLRWPVGTKVGVVVNRGRR
jgi:PASTA domain